MPQASFSVKIVAKDNCPAAIAAVTAYVNGPFIADANAAGIPLKSVSLGSLECTTGTSPSSHLTSQAQAHICQVLTFSHDSRSWTNRSCLSPAADCNTLPTTGSCGIATAAGRCGVASPTGRCGVASPAEGCGISATADSYGIPSAASGYSVSATSDASGPIFPTSIKACGLTTAASFRGVPPASNVPAIVTTATIW